LRNVWFRPSEGPSREPSRARAAGSYVRTPRPRSAPPRLCATPRPTEIHESFGWSSTKLTDHQLKLLERAGLATKTGGGTHHARWEGAALPLPTWRLAKRRGGTYQVRELASELECEYAGLRSFPSAI